MKLGNVHGTEGVASDAVLNNPKSQRMTLDEYRGLLNANHISQQMVAEEIGCSTSQVCLALKGKKPSVYARMLERCDMRWISAHARKPPPPRSVLSDYSEKAVQAAQQRVMKIHEEMEALGWDGLFDLYQGLVRGGHSYIMYHYFGLIRNVDLLIDDFENSRWSVDHELSIADGHLAKLPYWVVTSPNNLSVILEKDNFTKGRRSTKSPSELSRLFENFIAQYPRFWLVIDQSLSRTGIPKPYTEGERSIGQRWYRSAKSGRAFHETHKHLWGKNDTEIKLTYNLDTGELSSGDEP